MAWKNPTEIAELRVNGTPYRDWTAVTVIDDTDQAYPYFSFECTEFSEMPVSFAAMQIAPGDQCEIMLGGVLALTGFVMERQVGYAGKEHSILISGTATTYNTAISSIKPDTNGTYDNMSLEQVARKAAGYHGVNVKTIGQIPEKVFKELQHNPGELTYNFIERACRMRDVKLGSDALGNMLLIGDHEAMPSGELIEGRNILRASCVIRDTHFYERHFSIGQGAGHDDTYGDKANKVVGETPGKGKRPVWWIDMIDIPSVDKQEAKWRSDTSRRVFEGSEVQANITVQGWVQGNGALWKARESYHVKSPMLILDNPLTCKKITYDQRDGAGTTTTLEMVNPLYMKAHAPFAQPSSGNTPVVQTQGTNNKSVFDTGTTPIVGNTQKGPLG
ncbi:phage baseplate assembly protein [Bradyrhizobium sp. USDA 313]|uniref:phage baseplate assembly protein n=1 Tax=Bradyrhizobium sp. USDA 313 TaxID=3156307 RepID=UPI003518C9C9